MFFLWCTDICFIMITGKIGYNSYQFQNPPPPYAPSAAPAYQQQLDEYQQYCQQFQQQQQWWGQPHGHVMGGASRGRMNRNWASEY